MLTGTNTLQSGGILVNSFSVNSAISGGTLTSGQNELIVHAYGDCGIYSVIAATAGLTKTGPGTLTLGGFNSGLTGPININRGNLTVLTGSAVDSASVINFNDNRNTASQTFTVQPGNGVLDAIARPIQLSDNSLSSAGTFANVFSTGTSENSVVRLTNVISSAPGTVTPIRFTGTNTNSSGFVLNTTNTFTGDVTLSQGTLGINSNASFGNAVNTVHLNVNSIVGGLIFMNSSINVAHTIVLDTPTGIVSNNGDVNTISGPISGSSIFKDGAGTLILSGTNSQGGVTINAGTVRVGADANLGSAGGAIVINSGATLSSTGTFTDGRSLTIGPLFGDVPGTSTIDVAAGQTLTQNGIIGGVIGALLKTSAGTLALNSLANSYGGGTTVQQGSILAAGDGSLGAGGTPVTIGVAGSLTYTGSSTTTRTFMNSGTLTVPAGVTVTLNGASIYGGYLRGSGSFALTNGASLVGTSTSNGLATAVTAPGSLANFSNGGSLSVATNNETATTFNGFINQGSGSITLTALAVVSATDFQTYGTLTVNPATVTSSFSQTTLLTNTGTTPLYFNGGSRTFVGTPDTAVFPSNWSVVSQRGTPTFVAGIDLHGQNAVVAGGLFVNNGYVEDSTNNFAGTATIVADFGALVKGAGYFQNSVQTINGGKFQAGNSPGKATFGSFVLGPGGVSNYVFAIDDATGAAGPSPDARGHVSGWGLVQVGGPPVIGRGLNNGDLTWTATPSDKLLVALQTLVNPTTVGMDVSGPMDHFDSARSYAWPAVEWTGSYAGPADVAVLDAATAFDTTGFANPVAGTFAWSLDAAGHSLSLTYTPSAVPEPGTLTLTALALFPLATRRTRSAGEFA